MSFLCAILSVLMLVSDCKSQSPEYLDNLLPAARLRPEVERAISSSNFLLLNAGSKIKLVADWNDTTLHSDFIIIKVHLVKSPVKLQIKLKKLHRIEASIRGILQDNVVAHSDFINCKETDDCVEKLYKPGVAEIAVSVLNDINANEIGRTLIGCRCIILFQNDLRIIKAVFSANWDEWILRFLYNTQEELKTAFNSNRIPPALLDDLPMQFHSILPLVLLHEVGHTSTLDFDRIVWPKDEVFSNLIDSLNNKKREEIRADAFVASVYKKGCFSGLKLVPSAAETCLSNAMVSMLSFIVGLRGKSREARCLRFFDPNKNYPNWELRFLIKDWLISPESKRALFLFETYLKTRASLKTLPWVQKTPKCTTLLSRTYN